MKKNREHKKLQIKFLPKRRELKIKCDMFAQ